jgi:hypothetical protein
VHNIRVHKAITTLEDTYEAFIFGTSVTEFGYDPEHPYFEGMRTYNLGLPLVNMYEMQRYFSHVVASSPVKRVVFTFDFFSFNAYLRPGKAPIGFVDSLLATDEDGLRRSLLPRVSKHYLGLLSYDALRLSAKALKYNLGRSNYDASTTLYLSNGQRDWSHEQLNLERVGSYGEMFASVLGVTHKSYFPAPSFRFCIAADAGHLSDPMESFRAMLKLARERNIHVDVILSPSHAFEFEAIHYYGLTSQWEEWKRKITEIADNFNRSAASTLNRIVVADFQAYTSFNTETVPVLTDKVTKMTYYWESRHFKNSLGTVALSRLKRFKTLGETPTDLFGVPLSSANVDDHLAAVRASRESWRLDQPEQYERAGSILRMAKISGTSVCANSQ